MTFLLISTLKLSDFNSQVGMILFWNNTYWAGLADKSNRREMFHPIPAYCYVINYLVGSVFMSSFIIGVGLNPLIIIFNWSKRKVIISLLFILNASKSICYSFNVCTVLFYRDQFCFMISLGL